MKSIPPLKRWAETNNLLRSEDVVLSDALFFDPAQNSVSWLRSPDLVPLHAASRIGAHKVALLQKKPVCEIQTNEPRAVYMTLFRTATPCS